MDRLAKHEYRSAVPAAFTAAIMMVLACAITLFITLALFPPTAWYGDMAVAVSIFELGARIRDTGLVAAISENDLPRELLPRLLAGLLSVAVCGWATFRARRQITPIVDVRAHEEGLQLLRGSAAINSARATLAQDIDRAAPLIEWLPGVLIPRVREVRNLLIIGSIGSGKTRLILWLLDCLLQRITQFPNSDNAIFIHDTTGEILDGFPIDERDFAVINPDRPGFSAWAMGRDFRDDGDCESAADQIVGQTGDSFWGKGGSTLFAGCMITCRAERGTDWGAPKLYHVCLRDPVALKQAFEQHYPPAAALIEIDASTGELSKTTVSLLLTFRASVLRVLRPLAKAWVNVPDERQFSFGDWVSGQNPRQPKIVIVQRSGRHPEMSAAWIGMAMDFITGAIDDATLPKSQDRIRSFVLDEVPALGTLRRWPLLLDTGRNKGVSTIAAVQDIAQLKRLYPDASRSIFERFLTKIICAQTPGPEARDIASDIVGKRWVREKETATVIERGPAGRTQRTTVTEQKREVPIVPPESLAYRLGVNNGRVKALVVGLGDVLEIEWPMRIWPRRRT